MARNTYFNDEVINEKFNAKQLLRVLRYALPYKRLLLLVLAMMITAIGLSLLPALFLKYIVDTIIPSGDYKMLFTVLGVFLFTSAVDIVIQFFHSRLMAYSGHRIIYSIRGDIFKRLQTLSFDYFDNRPAGKIMVRLTAYIDELAVFFTSHLLNFIVNILRLMVVAVFLLILQTTLALVVLSIIVPMALFVIVIRMSLKKMFRNVRNKDSNRVAYINENILGVTVTKGFNRGSFNSGVYDELNTQAYQGWRKIIAINELFGPGVEIIWNIGNFLIYIVSLSLILSGSGLLAGTVIAFINYLGMFYVPINQIAVILQQFASVSSNLERIFETIDTYTPVKDSPGAKDIEIHGHIQFEDVTFSYDGIDNILQNFTLDVPQGKTFALVGPTGAGKSTIINLLPRFYNIKSGSILIDGKDITEFTLKSLRRQMGIMMQDSFIFKGTIMDNIRYNLTSSTDEECIEAAKKIYAHDFITKLPNGYMTEVNERGDGLSAGEKQLLSFARVMLKNPKILILDEATSSIDTNTEEKIQKALEALSQGRTSFIIAHRLSTIRKADTILYIADKGIAEQGTHRQLMQRKGLYYELNMRAKSEESEPAAN